MERGRLEAFSDGVFAVAITLLVLDLTAPPNGVALLTGLADRWPTFGAFGLSFVVIGIVWVNHHAIFGVLRTVDRPLLFINLALLLTVVLIPFTTALFARYLVAGGADSHIAAALYSATSLLMSVCFQVAYLWIGRHPGLRRDPDAPPVSVADVVRFGAGLVVYAACVAISFFSALLVFFLSTATAVYYVLDQATTRAPLES